MKTFWQVPGRTPQERSEAEFREKTRSLRPWHRIEGVSLSGIGAAIVLLGLLFTFLVATGERIGVFDAPMLRPIADQRLLTNVRDELADKPILDAVFHKPDREVYIAQQGGAIHRYDPATGLWSTDHPFDDKSLIAPDFVQLRSGCGADPTSARASACADPDSLWALSASGGLARHSRNGWEILVGDSVFAGASGRAIENAALRSVAVSDDARWLAFGTQEDGLGLYDNQRNAWLSLTSDFFSSLPAPSVPHLRWARGRFWIGTPQGLATIEMQNHSPRISASEVVTGDVIDLDVDEQDSVWVLQRRACADGTPDCLWLGHLDQDGQIAGTIIDEQRLFPRLTLGDLTFAQYWPDSNRLLVAGRAGIYSYDAVRHTWEELSDINVTASLGQTDGKSFLVGYVGGVGLVEKEGIRTWTLPGTRDAVQKLSTYDGNEVVALTEGGRLYSLDSTSAITPSLVFQASGTALQPESFTAATSLTDTVLFVGPQGGLLHDTVHRTYTDIPERGLPEWLRGDDTQMVGAGTVTYAVGGLASEQATIYPLPASRLTDPAYYGKEIASVQPVTLDGPVAQVWSWRSGEIGVLAGEGRVYQVTSQGASAKTGPAVPELDGVTVYDVAAVGPDLVLAADRGLRRYDGEERTWGPFFDPPDGRTAVELATLNDQVLARTEAIGRATSGRLVLAGENNEQILIGDGEGFEISDSGFTDARRAGDMLYMAGDGRVERYDTGERSITARWELGLPQPVELKDIVDNTPLSLYQEQVFLGDKSLDPGAGEVLSLSTDDQYIWTVREDATSRYLKGYSRSSLSESRCFFRQPGAGIGASRVLDARMLPEARGLLAVATDVGLRFYDPGARSWYAAQTAIEETVTRLYLLGEHLLVVQQIGNASRLSIGRADSIALPGSCSTGRVSFDRQDIDAIAYAVDESGGRLAWVESNGAVWSWQAGSRKVVLEAGGTGPDSTSLRRLFFRNDYLLFVSDETIWRYDLRLRSWRKISVTMSGGAGAIAAMNIEEQAQNNIVMAKTVDGAHFMGSFAVADGGVTLGRVLTPAPSFFGGRPNELLDVQKRDAKYWTFVLTDRIKYFDPARRSWVGEGLVGVPDPTLWYGRVGNRGVAVGQDGRRWWIAQTSGDTPEAFLPYSLAADETTAVDDDGRIWRLLPTGRLLRCDPPYDGESCRQAAESPFYFIPASLQKVIRWDQVILFGATDGFTAFSPTLGRSVPLPDTVAGFSGTAQVRIYEGQLWLYRSDTEALLQLQQSAGSVVAGQLTQGVREWLLDAGGRAWARFDDGWRVWWKAAFVDPFTLPGSAKKGDGFRGFAYEDGVVSGLDSHGSLYWWQQDRLQQERVPVALSGSVERTKVVAGDGAGEWWLQTDSHLERYQYRDKCPVSISSVLTPTAAASPSPTLPAGTPLPGEVVTKTTQLAPCIAPVGGVDLPAGVELAQAQILLGGSLKVWTAAGQSWRIEAAVGGYQLVSTQDAMPSLQGVLGDQWSQLQASARKLPSGQWAYDPITGLSIGPKGELIANRPSGNIVLTDIASLQPDPVPMLDAGWLKWDGSSFLVSTPGGRQAFRPEQFIVGGQLLFETPGVVLAMASDRVYVANRHGVWSHTSANLGLDQAAITFQPLRLDGALVAAHGRVISTGGQWRPGATALEAIAPRLVSSAGDVTFSEDVLQRRIEAYVQIGGRSAQAFVFGGFLWDAERRGLAYDGSILLVQSDAGIGPADRLAGFDVGPALGGQLRCCEAGFGPLLSKAGNWYQRTASGWSLLSTNPTDDRKLIDDSRWQWSLRGGQLTIGLAGEPFAFRSDVLSSYGFGFTSDRLRAAAAYEGKLYVATAAFLEVADQPDDFGAFTAMRFIPQSADLFDVLSVADGRYELFRRTAENISRWDNASGSFVSVSAVDDPYQRRVLAETERLRFTRLGNSVLKELKLADLGGNAQWVPYELVDERFPFDVVTALAVANDRLYVGSAVGLQVYPARLAADLGSLSSLLDMRGSVEVGQALSSVERMGFPETDPNVFMVRSAQACVEQHGGSAFVDCLNPALLDRRQRVRTDLWRWIGSPNREIQGQYINEAGRPAMAAFPILDGRFPHDRLTDVAVCQGQVVTLWQDGWVTVYPDETLRLAPGLLNHDLTALAPRRLICIDREVPLSQGMLSGGLYLEAAGGKVWRYSSSGWSELIDSQAVGAARERADRPPVFDHDGLRLLPRAEEAPLVFEHRTRAGRWLPLPWTSRTGAGDLWRVATDEWHEVISFGGQLWTATPIGLVAFQRDAAGQAILQPDDLLIVRELRQGDQTCEITDLDVLDSEVWVRCGYDSAQVYRGSLPAGQDSGLFQRHTGSDPLAEMTLVSAETDGVWEWRRVGRKGGDPGYLESALHGEKVDLVGGRFTFDTINSVALLEPKRLDVGTDVGGWYQIPTTNGHVLKLTRSASPRVDAAAVTHVGVSRQDGQSMLCLANSSGGFTRVKSKGEVEDAGSCPEYLGDDGLWQYARDGDAVLITAPDRSVGGLGKRTLTGGRFPDDIAISVPVTVRQGEERAYFVPTLAGVLQLGQDLKRRAIHVPPFAGLPENAVPAAVFSASASFVTYVGSDALYSLDAVREPLPAPSLALPDGATLRAAEDGPQDTVRLLWEAGGRRGWSLLGRDAAGIQLDNGWLVDVSGFDKYMANRAAWGTPQPWLLMTYASGELNAQGLDREISDAISLPEGFELLAPILFDERVLLFARRELLEVNLERAMVEAFTLPKTIPLTAEPVTPLASVPFSPSSAPSPTPSLTVTPFATPAPSLTATLPYSATPTEPPTPSATPSATPLPTATLAPFGRITEDKVNVRSGPGTEYPVITQLGMNTTTEIIGVVASQDWWEVILPSGGIGWVSARYLDMGGCLTCVALVTPPPTPTPRPTSTPSPTQKPLPTQPRRIATNRDSFSGSQGAGGWTYLMESGRNSGQWMPMQFDGQCYRTGNSEHDVRICAGGEVHPGVTTRIAYQWRPSFSGTISVTVHAHKIDTRCGDGTWIGVFRVRDGVGIDAKLGEFRIDGGDNTGVTRTYRTTVDPGNFIYVIVDIGGESTCDLTRVYVDIN